ncbi:TOMM precursor leader peptide-binding protein [Nocardiopsis sp. RSe5-2]|uniref:TOMM leader peptide-binding protein n=1 Tax=Nocardiopsis endophytica TaxID=3018445 RepID=A0ABT4U788_9ACTN|nr:TOMM precursor leader peptide-binding protein [Nocardiopsis endophytica]MDA2812300.1 TOMM precursor leader peptide-binding protein [Nocardiopsis endophytica]
MADSPGVRVEGTGLLAAAVTGAVREPVAAEPPELAVSVSDCWRDDEELRRWARDHAVPWLPVRTELGTVVVGPLERPGAGGCLRCAQERRHRASPDPEGTLAAFTAHRDTLAATPSTLLTPLAADTVAALVAAEAARAADGGLLRTAEAFLRVDLRTLEVSRHPFLPDPRCPDCAEHSAAPPGGPGEPVASRPRPKPDPHTYRLRPDLDPADLRARFVEPEAGLIRELQYGTTAGMALVRAPMRLRDRHRSKSTESGYGRTRDFRTSETVAICEALERYGGLRQGDRPEVVRATYHEVAERAVDVSAIGLHPPESYAQEGFGCTPFDPGREYGWVQGYSFARRGPVLVPERLAYYGTGGEPGRDPMFVLESSNGGATGSCLEEAVLHGLLEVVERDAFLMTWYARLPVPRVDPYSAADRTIPMLVEQIRHEQGYAVSLYDTTLDHGVPSVWAMAVRLDGDESRPRLSCAAGAHLQPERAVLGALAELGPILDGLIGTYPGEAERVGEMVADPEQVQRMADHGLLYADSRVFDRLRFLTGTEPRPGVPIGASFGTPEWPPIAGADLTGDLLALAGRLLADGLDVVAVDQTTSEHRRAGLSCVKVLVPGMLPMTFGHAYRRIHGLPRLREVPYRLGYAPRPLDDADINPFPHPFP